jgi:aspartate/methionine/tyrosine aminotransferase
MEAAWAAERAGRSIVHLEVGEPDFGTPAPVVDAATKAIADGRVRYTSSLGIPELREAISGYYADRFGVDVPARRVVVTTGASGALTLALAATVDRDDGILLADPGYPCNRNLIRLCEGVPRGIPVGPESEYQLTAGLVADHWDGHTSGVLLATPSNPTGTLVPPDELSAIAAAAAERGGVCFVDEIYGELVYDRRPATVLAAPGLGDTGTPFVINSFSKTFGMTGWRLGWMVCPDWALSAVEALAQNAFISPPAPARTAPWPPSPPRCGPSSKNAGRPSPPGATSSSRACGPAASAYR